MNYKKQKGFSLLELLLYIGIAGVAAGLMTGVLTNVLKVQVKESASNETLSQLNFVNQTIQRLVRESSLIETEAGTATSTLKLRMADSGKDPTYISLVDGVIKLTEGVNPVSDLTTDKVIVNTLDFKKFSQYPGHDVVSIDIALTSVNNPQISQSLRSGVARVSAATFDSDILPGGPPYNFSIGQSGSPWQNLYVSGDICSEQYGCFSGGGGGGGGVSGSGTENYIAKWAAGNPSTSLDSSVIYQYAGNVGINTTTPQEKLHVSGGNILLDNDYSVYFKNVGTGWYGTLQMSTTNNFQMFNYADSGNLQIGMNNINNNGGIVFYTKDAQERMRIDGAGNVGIGTTNPGNILHVEKARNDTISSVAAAYRLGGSDVYLFGGSKLSSPYSIWMQVFRPSDDATFPLVLNPNGGNVGIGITGPSYKLDVSGGDINVSGVYRKAGTAGSSVVCASGNTPSGITVSGGIVTSAGSCTAIGGGTSLWTDPGTYIYPNNYSSFVITDTGNVGIGTTSPGTKLEVVMSTANTGAIKISDGSSWLEQMPNLGAGGYNPLSQSGDIGLIFSDGAQNTGNLVIGPWSSSAAGIRITNTGNVGIGTTSPLSKLSVGGNGQSGVEIYGNGNGNIGVYGSSSGTAGVYGTGGTITTGVYGSGLTGVYGSGTNTGVYGSSINTGVYGYSNGTTGAEYGVYGYKTGNGGAGVYGENTSGMGIIGKGTSYSFYASGTGTDYGTFTGGHDVILEKGLYKKGMIVSLTGKNKVRLDDKGEISISSTLPTVKLSDKINDKSVFGVFAMENPLPEDHWYKAKEDEKFGIVNALGEGRVLVTNINGDIQSGDYITTSPIAGYGQKQNDDLLHSYTLGKATENVDWDKVTETIEFNGHIYKVYLIAVVYVSG